MELRCSCGAFPPEDARFCHKCGAPLHPDTVHTGTDGEAETSGIVQPPPIPAHLAPVVDPANGIGFNNAVAIRVGMMAAGISMLLCNLAGLLPPALRLPGFIALVGGGGFLAVFLYMRRTGVSVNVLGGARLGWITGAFFFVINLVLFAITYVLAAPEDLAKLAEEFRNQGVDSAEWQRILDKPDLAAALLMLGLVVYFATTSIMASVGGALGAKYFENRSHG